MKKLFPFMFLAALCGYEFYAKQLDFLHKPVIAGSLYVIAIIVCASFIADIKKQTKSNNSY
ncbi:hypothetical protein U8V72_14375 [Priestia filamentosa]|uniref:hypothetical protein n=1 Tax=Priestia filamentosa TaxID=1402861 RepID=UPI003979B512